LDAAARTVLHDWNVGKIRYFTQPPAVHPSAIPSAPAKGAPTPQATTSEEQVIDNTIGSSVVTGYSEAFDLAALLGEADAEAFGGLDTSDETKLGKSAPAPPARRYAQDESTIEEDEEPEKEISAADLSTNSTLGKRQRDELDSDDEEEEEEEPAGMDSDEEADTLLGGNSTGAWEARAISKNLMAATTKKPKPLPVFQKKASPPLPVSDVNEPEWLQRQKAKAALPNQRTTVEANRKQNGRMHELSSVFSEEELRSLAPARGAARKKAKKQKRREDRAGAGLVNALESAMDLKKAEGDASKSQTAQNQTQRKGLFDLLEQSGGKAVDEDEEL